MADEHPDSGEPDGDCSEQWTKAKAQARRALVRLAKLQQTINYRKFVRLIKAIPDLNYHGDERLDRLLTEISLEEATEGRGLLSVLVVNAGFPGLPSDGFWVIAEPRYPDGTTRNEIFQRERDKVWQAHQ